jgi:thioredoxin 1
MIHAVTDRNFRADVLGSSIPVLVTFEAPWCGLCKFIKPTLIEFQDRWDEQIRLVSVNADENLKLASTYKLKSLPTVILFTHGRIIDRLEGFRGREDLRESLDRLTRIRTMNWQTIERESSMRIDWQLATSE